MLLNELLNSKTEIKINRSSDRFFLAETTIGNLKVEYEAMRADDRVPDDWEVAFSTVEVDKNGDNLGRRNFGITGSGSELKILAFVKECTLMFVKDRNPRVIWFTADKDGGKSARANVYEKMVQRWNVPGYKFSKTESTNKAKFRLERERNFND